ncbi:MAG: TRAP transporter permease [Treponema sp.]|nr:TRAP transporter permease [Treponema sp.]
MSTKKISVEERRGKYDRVLETLILVSAVSVTLYHLYIAFSTSFSLMQQRIVHLFCFLIMWFLLKCVNKKETRLGRALAGFAAALSAVIGVYFVAQAAPMVLLQKGIWGISTLDMIAGIFLVLLILEVSRQAVGLALPIIAMIFILFALAGPILPPIIAHKGYDISYITSYVAWTSEGIFGTPIGAATSFVVLYIIFGEMLDQFGAGQFFIDIAYALTGRMRGGPAEASVVSSALMGSINGSAVANVVTTGTFTIPLMKKVGYKAEYAGAVEAVASTGGQILPPVMGAAAFVMADMTGIPYSSIIIAAFIPGILYYLSLGFAVYFEAGRLGIKADTQSARVSMGEVFRRGWYHLIPLGVLIFALLVLGLSAGYSALFALGAMLSIGIIRTFLRERRFPLKELKDVCLKTARTAVPVSLACASAGIVIGIVSMTGLGVRFTQIVVELSGGRLFPMLLLIMVACIVLGMGLPSTAAYVIAAAVGAPALLNAGIPALGANLFVFYFAIISFITPPVAIASYAAAGLAGGSSTKTGYLAFKLGIAGFIIPFLYIYHPGLLILGTSTWETLYALMLAVGAVVLIAASFEGWVGVDLLFFERFALILAAVMLIATKVVFNVAGLIIGASVLMIVYLRNRRSKAAAGVV